MGFGAGQEGEMKADLEATLPLDAANAVLVGRVWMDGLGAVLVRVTPEAVLDWKSASGRTRRYSPSRNP